MTSITEAASAATAAMSDADQRAPTTEELKAREDALYRRDAMLRELRLLLLVDEADSRPGRRGPMTTACCRVPALSSLACRRPPSARP